MRELARLAEPVNQAIVEIRDTEGRLGQNTGLVGGRQDKERVSRQRTIVEEYLHSITQGIGQIRRLLRSAESPRLRGTVENVASRLSREKQRVDVATRKLADG